MAIENDLHLFESNGFVGFLCHLDAPPSSLIDSDVNLR
jgi:hypothetical protein